MQLALFAKPERKSSGLVIIGLDLATKTGWAVAGPSGVESGVQDFSLQRGESPGMRYLKFQAWLEGVHDRTGFQLAAYEMPHMRGGHSTTVLIGLETRLHGFCADKGVNHKSVHSSSIKKHATGKGNASKEMMIAAAEDAFNKSGLTDDEADALWTLDWAMKEYG